MKLLFSPEWNNALSYLSNKSKCVHLLFGHLLFLIITKFRQFLHIILMAKISWQQFGKGREPVGDVEI